MSRYGDGIGVGEDLHAAAVEAVGRALAPLDGQAPDLAVVFVSGQAPDVLREVGERALAMTGATATLGCSATGVIGGGQGVEARSAVSVFVARLPGATLKTFHLEVMPVDEGSAVIGMPELDPGAQEVAVLLADPYSFPVDGFVARAATTLPGLPIVGGIAAGTAGPGSTALFVDGHAVDRGAVRLLVSGASALPLVSQGCRPVGPPMTVTASQGNLVTGLAGKPALMKVREVLVDLPPADQALASGGLQLGIAADEYAVDHDHLVRGILGTSGEGLVVGDLVDVGQTVRLQVRDADAADDDLRAVLRRVPRDPGSGVLLFSCTGRGAGLFSGADHDVQVVREELSADAVAGFFAGGEIGPVAGRSHLHTFTATMVVLP